MVDDLVECEQREVDRHQLDDRAQAGHRRADPGTDDRVLGDRSVADPLLAEPVEQSLGDLEGALEYTYVFAHDEDVPVALHLLGDRVAERFAHAHRLHAGLAVSADSGLPGGPGCVGGAHPRTPGRSWRSWSLGCSAPDSARTFAMSGASSPNSPRCGSGERSSTAYQPIVSPTTYSPS